MVKVILMRHAQSVFNVPHDKLHDQFEAGEITKLQLDERLQALQRTYDVGLVNARITDKGHEQCLDAREEVYKRYPNIKRVILSPLRRVIQTFESTFAEYPQFKSKTLKISFVEELRECLYSSGDVACWTEDEKSDVRFPELYDWSFLNKYRDRDFWFLEVGSKNMYDKAMALRKNSNSYSHETLPPNKVCVINFF